MTKIKSKKPKTTQRNTTIDILAKELQLKQGRLDKHREKILEQQEVLIHKNKRIAELKEEVETLKHDWQMCDNVCDKKQFEILSLRQELKKKPEGYFRFGKFIPGKKPMKPNGEGSK